MKENDMKATMNCKMNVSEQCGIDSLSTILANENEHLLAQRSGLQVGPEVVD